MLAVLKNATPHGQALFQAEEYQALKAKGFFIRNWGYPRSRQ